MKKLLILTLLVSSLGAIAQGEGRQMNGQYTFKDTISFDKQLFLDSNIFDYVPNSFLSLDSSGLASTGYLKVITSASPALGGTGAATNISIWENQTSLSYDTTGDFRIVNALTTGNGLVTQLLGGLTVISNFTSYDPTGITNISTAMGTQDLSVTTSAGNLLLRPSTGLIGINEANPTFPLSIQAEDRVAIGLKSPLELPTGSSTMTFTNAPSAGNPDKYLLIDIDGLRYYIPAKLVP